MKKYEDKTWAFILESLDLPICAILMSRNSTISARMYDLTVKFFMIVLIGMDIDIAMNATKMEKIYDIFGRLYAYYSITEV